MNLPLTKYFSICIKNNITMVVHEYNYAKELIGKEINKKLKIHLKIDFGMNR